MPYPRPVNPLDPRHVRRVARVIVLCVLGLSLAGCGTGPDKPRPSVPLPELGNDGRLQPRGIYAIIRRADLPLDQPTDDAWAIINEQAVPALTQGAWRGNGLRLGLLRRDQLDAYAKAMPQPVAFGEAMINQSPHPVPIIESPRLNSDVFFEVNLTRPPMPTQVETITGGKGSSLRLLAHIQTDQAGNHTLVLTPQHHIPAPFDLIPRDPLEKEKDGRIYNELTVRLTLDREQVAVVGLHWPWPMREVLADEPEADTGATNASSPPRPVTPPANTDPAAPPAHITRPGTVRPGDTPTNAQAAAARDNKAPQGPGEPSYERVAPPLTTHLGSALFTGMRIRQPVRSVLLITIEAPTKLDPEAQAIEAE